MAKRTITVTKSQINEILGGNSSWLDGEGTDKREDGVNSVYTGDKTELGDAKPLTTDKYAKQRSIDYGPWLPGGRGGVKGAMVYTNGIISCSKENWMKANLSEENQNLIHNTYGDNECRVSNNNASTMKSEYKKAQEKSRSNDPQTRNAGLRTMREMEKNHPNIQQIINQYDTAVANDQNIKKTEKASGKENVYQKAGGRKMTGNGKAHSPKGGVLTFLPNNG